MRRLRISMSVFVTMPFFVSSPFAKEVDQLPDGYRTQLEERARIGNCLGSSGAVDLSSLWKLEDTEVTIQDRGEHLRVAVQDERVYITKRNEKSMIVNVAQFVNDTNYDPDLIVKLATFNGKLVVYWRESFLHRSYRQGILSITKEGPATICQGIAGSDKEVGPVDAIEK